MLTDDRRVMPLTLLAQAGVGLCLAALVWPWLGEVAAASVAAGAMVAVIPNAFLAARLLSAANDARAILRSAWVGELGKLVLTALLFGAVFAFVRPLSVMAVFGGFIAAQLVVLGALLVGGEAGTSPTEI
ncbi:ATP synthase subunit I [Candidatus Rariloculus sp.]|uniref:ATP synthase subunit I n=1 Tax=Candidatus Rariloculus sp. TaxID=3101265 RepID=UPI003D0FCD81